MDKSEGLLTSDSPSAPPKTSKFLIRLRRTIIIITGLVAGASAIFILINTLLFAVDAFQSGRTGNELKMEVLEKLVILICKFLMLLMFTSSLVMGALIPLGLMYVILRPEKVEEKHQ